MDDYDVLLPLGKHLRVLQEHMGVVRCLHINEDRLVSGGDQSMVVVWDYKVDSLSISVRHILYMIKLLFAELESIG